MLNSFMPTVKINNAPILCINSSHKLAQTTSDMMETPYLAAPVSTTPAVCVFRPMAAHWQPPPDCQFSVGGPGFRLSFLSIVQLE